MKNITKKQKEVLDYIKSYSDTHECAPTQKEIKEHFGFKSFGSVQRYIKYLSNAGYLANDWNARRGLSLVSKNQEGLSSSVMTEEIPLLGLVAAGNPIEAIENPEDTIEVPKYMIAGNRQYFALKVRGDSMIEDGILEDDIIVCQSQTDARQGQTVVAVYNGEATVKKFFKKESHVELHPANSSMTPFIIDHSQEDFKIAGTLVGLLRSYV